MACKQTSRKVLLIEVFEDVLVLQEAEDCDHLEREWQPRSQLASWRRTASCYLRNVADL